MNILITGVGGANARGIARILKAGDGSAEQHRLIGTDSSRLGIGLYARELFDAVHLVPRADADPYWPVIEEIVEGEAVDLALIQPEDEVEAWARHQRSSPLPCRALVPPLDLVRVCRDKAWMSSILATDDLVPRTLRLAAGELRDAGAPQDGPAFPCWMRAASGAGGRGSFKARSWHDVQAWAALNPEIQAFTLSDFLPGRNLACKVLFHRGVLLRAGCAERVSYIMAHASPSGVTGNTAFGRLINDRAVVAVAERALRALAKHVDVELSGFFTVDLKEDVQGIPKVTEVNIRHVAFTEVFAVGGARFIEDTITLLTRGPASLGGPRVYEFPEPLVFLRDVDVEPVVLHEHALLSDACR